MRNPSSSLLYQLHKNNVMDGKRHPSLTQSPNQDLCTLKSLAYRCNLQKPEQDTGDDKWPKRFDETCE